MDIFHALIKLFWHPHFGSIFENQSPGKVTSSKNHYTEIIYNSFPFFLNPFFFSSKIGGPCMYLFPCQGQKLIVKISISNHKLKVIKLNFMCNTIRVVILVFFKYQLLPERNLFLIQKVGISQIDKILTLNCVDTGSHSHLTGLF